MWSFLAVFMRLFLSVHIDIGIISYRPKLKNISWYKFWPYHPALPSVVRPATAFDCPWSEAFTVQNTFFYFTELHSFLWFLFGGGCFGLVLCFCFVVLFGFVNLVCFVFLNYYYSNFFFLIYVVWFCSLVLFLFCLVLWFLFGEVVLDCFLFFFCYQQFLFYFFTHNTT